MKTLLKRLGRLEASHAAQTTPEGLTPADVLRQRMCRRKAQETGRPYEEVLREHLAEHRAFWSGYTGPRTHADILRYARQHRMASTEVSERKAC